MRTSPALLTVQEVFKELATSQYGLSRSTAKKRLEKWGSNSFPEPPRPHPVLVFLRQFSSPLIIILLIAAAVLLFQSERVDACIVLCVLVINAIIGLIQDGKTHKALQSLKRYEVTSALVVREKQHQVISDTELVPGDIVILKEGDKVPADIRLFRVHGLLVNEALLTGESESVEKQSEAIKSKEADQRSNMVYKGTYITSGGAIGVVVATGLDTEIGAIYEDILKESAPIPLQRDVAFLSGQIIALLCVVSVGLVVLNTLHHVALEHTVALIISLAVSIIPEGLPIVLTYVLAQGVATMARRHVLVKRMQAVEILGRTKVLAVDKTGTITKNELAVVEMWMPETGRYYQVSADGYNPRGVVGRSDKRPLTAEDSKLLRKLSYSAALCSTAVVEKNEHDFWQAVGEPTEAALTVLAEKLKTSRQEIEKQAVLVKDYGFDYGSKLHYVVHKYRGSYLVSVAGAPENILRRTKLSKAEHATAETAIHQLASQGLRVVGLGQVLLKTFPNRLENQAIELTGLVGIQDTLHTEVPATVRRLRAAGLKTVMITGDHVETARALAGQAGIFVEGDRVITGVEIESLTEAELAQVAPEITVFARVTPSHKLRIVKAFQAAGIEVAMTGDGVNDAPSLSAANLGIAMGLRGTEVAKESAELILLDDNLSSLVAAVEEGRAIYAAIQRVVTYLFAGTITLVVFIVISLFMSGHSPLYPSQVIWLNFVTDVLLVLALAREPKEHGLLKRSYVHPNRLLTGQMLMRIGLLVVPMAAAAVYAFTQTAHQDLAYAGTLALTVLAATHWLNAWNVRSSHLSLFNSRFLLTNKPLIAMTAVAILFQLLAVYLPFLQRALHTVPLTAQDWLFVVIVVLPVVAIEEVRKSFS